MFKEKIYNIFVGQSGVGKSTYSEFIVDNNYRIASSTILKEELVKRCLEINHDNFHKVGMEKIMEDPAWQAKQVVERAKNKNFFIFDGPRSPYEIDYFLQNYSKVNVVGFFAPKKLRYQRIIQREKNDMSYLSFIERCADEVLDAGLHNCLKKANVIVINGGDSLEKARVHANDLKKVLIGELISDSNDFINYDKISESDIIQNFQNLENELSKFEYAIFNDRQIKDFIQVYLKVEETILKMFREGSLEANFFDITGAK